MSPKVNIVLVEDELNICNFITAALKTEDYKLHIANNGTEGLGLITSLCPDIILLDLGLPDIDGMEIIKNVRSWSSAPIIVISARVQERDKVAALDSGADDYITKPFGTSELLARIRTSLRHSNRLSTNSQLNTRPYSALGLTIDFDKRRVSINGQEVHLTQIEYKLLSLLAKNSGKVLTYSFIINEIWGPYADKKNNQILRVNMANIRRKIEATPAEPKYVFTEIGIGYRMLEDDM